MKTKLRENRIRSWAPSVTSGIVVAAALLVLAGSAFLRSAGAEKPAPPATGYLHDFTIDSEPINRDFTPDGDLSKAIWRGRPRVKFDLEVRAQRRFPDSETQVQSLWTRDYLYLGYRCRYRELNVYTGEDISKERFGLWIKDTAEAFINPNPEHISHYYEFEVAPNNQWVDLEIDVSKKFAGNVHWDSGFEHAVKVDAKHHVWTAEMKIPVKSMGVNALTPGIFWRLNFYRLDGMGDDPQRRFLAWSPLPPGENRSFHQPTSFGIIKFVGGKINLGPEVQITKSPN